MRLFLALTLALAGCEIAFPITLDAAEIEDDAADASGEADASDAPAELDRFDQDRREK